MGSRVAAASAVTKLAVHSLAESVSWDSSGCSQRLVFAQMSDLHVVTIASCVRVVPVERGSDAGLSRPAWALSSVFTTRNATSRETVDTAHAEARLNESHQPRRHRSPTAERRRCDGSAVPRGTPNHAASSAFARVVTATPSSPRTCGSGAVRTWPAQ